MNDGSQCTRQTGTHYIESEKIKTHKGLNPGPLVFLSRGCLILYLKRYSDNGCVILADKGNVTYFNIQLH